MSRKANSRRSADDLPFMQMSELLDALRWPGLGQNVHDVSAPVGGGSDALRVSGTLVTSNPLMSSQARRVQLNSTAIAQSNMTPPQDVVARYESEILPIARALFPASALEPQEPMTIGKLSRMHLRLLIYALSNDFAGLRPHTTLKTLHEYIKEPMTIWLDEAMRPGFYTSGLLSMAPLAEGLFTCAVEAGDMDTVARLLSKRGPGVDVNAHFCNVDGVRYTAIERSAGLQHLALTNLLLEVGADANKTLNEVPPTSRRPRRGYWDARDTIYSRSSLSKLPKPCGALECAIRGYSKGSQLGRDLVLTLSQAGATVDFETMFLMIDSDEDDILEVILRACLVHSYESWSYAGFFFRFARRASTPLLNLVLHELINQRMDLDVALVSEEGHSHAGTCCLWKDAGWPPFWIDILARRGELDLVKMLVENGSSITANVLVAATIGRHSRLIAYLLEIGALPETFSHHYRTTALAEAVRSRDKGICQLMSQQPRADIPMTDNQWCALLAAYAEVGDESVLTCLIQQGRHRHTNLSSILGYALTIATRSNNLPGAISLLEAGASMDCHTIALAMGNADCKVRHGWDSMEKATLCPLVSALQCRNLAFVEQLLDHGASLANSMYPALTCGDIDTMKFLIASGIIHHLHDSDFGYGTLHQKLATAAHAHPECALLVLRAGGVLPRGVNRGIIGQADMHLIEEFLGHGAAIVDADTLAFALQTSMEVFLIVLEAVYIRSPQGLGLLGQRALDIAVRKTSILLERGAAQVPYDCGLDPWDHRRLEGETHGSALLTAICERKPRMVEMLLRARPVAANEACGRGRYRKTPLLASLGTCDAAVLQVLLQHGADINLPATRGIDRTPLQRATELGSDEFVHLLLDCGADVNASPAARGGATALQLAASGGYLGIAQLLLKHGATLTAAGSVVDGRIALEGAAEHGRFDMVVFLVRKGPHQVPKMRSAKEYAQKGGYSAIVELLEDAITEADTPALDDRPVNTEEPYFDDARAANGENDEMVDASADNISDGEADHVTHQSLSQQRHTCNICGASLCNASALRRHERSVHGDVSQGRQWACGQCDKSFSRKDVWKRHEASHDKTGYKKCLGCGESFRPDYHGRHAIGCQG
ncbi:hypothetical protein LTR86_006768 [Recurvomyces mirabilis]|nr:hypothetical protein LTR86_006768 [Recurvomyces mirabilis]